MNFNEVPFIPISFFKDQEIRTGEWTPQAIFQSSGTSGQIRSKHLIRELSWYHEVSKSCFTAVFGDPSSYVWLAMLPSYVERDDSSLVEMVHYLMHIDLRPQSQFISDADALADIMEKLSLERQKTILIGVSFALLDLFEHNLLPVWPELTIIETGGMKGRGPEITREELHNRIRAKHPSINLASEYGMTELQSQAYLTYQSFLPGPTLKAFARDISDPMNLLPGGKRGALNFIDLANLDTCSFIATDDVGTVHGDGTFDVAGRLDQSDIRGCNLLYA